MSQGFPFFHSAGTWIPTEHTYPNPPFPEYPTKKDEELLDEFEKLITLDGDDGDSRS